MNRFLLPLVLALTSLAFGQPTFETHFDQSLDRQWCGPEFWANRLQDWKIEGGRALCLGGGPRLSYRTLHLLTRRLDPARGPITITLRFGRDAKTPESPAARAGLLLGVGGADLDYRSAALVHHWAGTGAGEFVGVENGTVHSTSMGDRATWTEPPVRKGQPLDLKDITLTVTIEPADADQSTVTLVAIDGNGTRQETRRQIATAKLTGGIAFLAHPAGKNGREGTRWSFEKLTLAGDGVTAHDERTFGPIASTQYTVSGGIMKMTAQMLPLTEADHQEVHLELWRGKEWERVATSTIVVPGYTAPFRVEEWDATQTTPYRVVYGLRQNDGTTRTSTWAGTIRQDPVAEQELVLGAFSCHHMLSFLISSPESDWTSQVWFPHQDITSHVKAHDPDLLFFAGDQIYEGNSPSFADRGEIMDDYIYKWLLWCWSFRDLTRDIPTVTMPDDHDVYQGNLWGENGRKAKRDHFGGYVHPAEFVKMVERTQTSHLPDPFDPTPIEQGIGVYYTHLEWGRVGFAILEDRKFKSGCARPEMPSTGTKRPDHVLDADYDITSIDVEGLKLLGDRQLRFLDEWARDWTGQDMKAALSQTVFAGMASHHGGNLEYLRADLDSNGWPQAGRNRAVAALRRAFALHVGGDQHLATIVQHGIADFGDSNWSFCVPAVANFYPRKWDPKTPGAHRAKGAPTWSGEHFDGLGNRVTVHAATNPRPMKQKPAALHDKMPGYGIVRFNKANRSITMECWPRFAIPGKDKQYEGWPRTIQQTDNYGRAAKGHLANIVVTGLENPVIRVLHQNGELVYALRITGQEFRPKVFDTTATYRIEVGDPGVGFQSKDGLRCQESGSAPLQFRF